MDHFSTILNRISSFFFMVAMLGSKLKLIPIPLVSAISHILHIAAHLLAYITWYVAALYIPNHPRQQTLWYGFTSIKYQNQLAALIGLAATILSLLIPALALPIAWLYTLSTLIWCVAELHQLKNPLPDKNHSSEKQTYLFHYTLFITAISVIAALSMTLIFLFPALSLAFVVGSTVLSLSLGLAACYCLGKSTFGHFEADKIEHTYHKLSNQLNPTTTSNEPFAAPIRCPSPNIDPVASLRDEKHHSSLISLSKASPGAINDDDIHLDFNSSPPTLAMKQA